MASPLSRIMRLAALAISLRRTAMGFAGPRSLHPGTGGRTVKSFDVHDDDSRRSRVVTFSSTDDDGGDWGLESDDDDDAGKEKEEDPRMGAMRSILESSWDDSSMGIVPSGPQKGAQAAAESIADAMARNHNVMMVDLRLPSYDITEGPELYDHAAAYDFCAFLSDELRKRGLVRKSLVLVRNDQERKALDGVRSRRRDARKLGNSDAGGGNDVSGTGGTTEEGGQSEVDDFRKNLMESWDGVAAAGEGVEVDAPRPASETETTRNDNVDPSHRLWSMVGNEEISEGPDMFDQVIAAVDENAILLSDEDALIILSPYSTADIIGIRRIMARYGQTRTVIVVNSRMETLPREMGPAVLAYGILPLIAMSKGSDGGNNDAGIKVVALKRFPSEWSLYIDVYGDGFVEAGGGGRPFIDATGKGLPSPEWIAQRVQAHVEGLPRQ